METILSGMLMVSKKKKATINLIKKIYFGHIGINLVRGALKNGEMVFYLIPLNMNIIQMAKLRKSHLMKMVKNMVIG